MRVLTVSSGPAVVPIMLVGGFVLVIGLGFVPNEVLVLGLMGLAALSGVLSLGWGESVAARVLGLARGPGSLEAQGLAGAGGLASARGLGVDRVLVRWGVMSGFIHEPATPIGRRSVIVEPWVIDRLRVGELTNDDVAALLAHAAAFQRDGLFRFDLAVRVWTWPCAVVMCGVAAVARGFGWVPAAGVTWRMRILVGVVALLQGFQAGGNRALGIVAFCVVSGSYLVPAAGSWWFRRAQSRADRLTAGAGFARALEDMAWARDTGSVRTTERVQHIRENAARSEADV